MSLSNLFKVVEPVSVGDSIRIQVVYVQSSVFLIILHIHFSDMVVKAFFKSVPVTEAI